MSRSMDRLDRARPDIADAIDRDALFAQIVATPQDHEQPQISRSGRRRLLIGCIALAVLCLTAGTAFAVTGFNLFGWHTDTTIVKSPREWQRLYRDATRQLTLPPGEHWPDRTLPPDTVTSRTQPGGTAVAISQTAWECYWVDAIRHGDTAGGAAGPRGARRPAGAPRRGGTARLARERGTARRHQATVRDLRLRRRHPVHPQDVPRRGQRPPRHPDPELPGKRPGRHPLRLTGNDAQGRLR